MDNISFDPYSTNPQVDLHKFQLQQKKVEDLVHRVFDNEEGLKLLGYLEAATILQPSFLPGQDVSYSYFREGQNDLVRQLIRMLEKAKKNNLHRLFKEIFLREKST